jgi:hypothetical protein
MNEEPMHSLTILLLKITPGYVQRHYFQLNPPSCDQDLQKCLAGGEVVVESVGGHILHEDFYTLVDQILIIQNGLPTPRQRPWGGGGNR